MNTTLLKNIYPRKSLGQKFLVDKNFLQFIVRKAEISPSDDVIEIGAGTGTLTSLIAEKARMVWAFEIDDGLYQLCKKNLQGKRNVLIFNECGTRAPDLIKSYHLSNNRSFKVVSNLPYSDYRKILEALVCSRLPIQDYFLLLQFEVYEKIKAINLKRGYSPISVIVKSQCDVDLLRTVPKEVFYPRPKVLSAFVRLHPLKNPLINKDELAIIIPVISDLFKFRRKKLRSVLSLTGRHSLKLDSKILDKRIEELPVPGIIEVARNFIK